MMIIDVFTIYMRTLARLRSVIMVDMQNHSINRILSSSFGLHVFVFENANSLQVNILE